MTTSLKIHITANVLLYAALASTMNVLALMIAGAFSCWGYNASRKRDMRVYMAAAAAATIFPIIHYYIAAHLKVPVALGLWLIWTIIFAYMFEVAARFASEKKVN